MFKAYWSREQRTEYLDLKGEMFSVLPMPRNLRRVWNTNRKYSVLRIRILGSTASGSLVEEAFDFRGINENIQSLFLGDDRALAGNSAS